MDFIGVCRPMSRKSRKNRSWTLLQTLFLISIYQFLEIFNPIDTWNSTWSNDTSAQISWCERCAKISLRHTSWRTLTMNFTQKSLHHKCTWQSCINHFKINFLRVCRKFTYNSCSTEIPCFLSLFNTFWAWDLAWVDDQVWTTFWTFFQSDWNSRNA